MTCGDLTDMKDMSGRKVCTRLSLYLEEHSCPGVSSKVTLHFYHTSCTVQAQGSSLMSCGTCSPVWLVNNLIEPLVTSHSKQNHVEIDTINTCIRQNTTTLCCSLCQDKINPNSTHPRDQELACSNCGRIYHKKCTDRKKTPGNWRKAPWYCQGCILGPQSSTQAVSAAPPSSTPPAPFLQDSVLNINVKTFASTQSTETPLARFLALNSQSTDSL